MNSSDIQLPDGVRQLSKLPAAMERSPAAHKGDFGHVLVVAGSRGMSGAAVLAGRGALHGGAGLVTIATAQSAAPVVAASHPSYMTAGLDEDAEGRIRNIGQPLREFVQGNSGKVSAIAVGPGLGQSNSVRQMVLELMTTATVPIVVDADGLNAIAQTDDALNARSTSADTIFTPHPGEFARLTGLTTPEIQSNRVKYAVDYARKHHVVLLLKGAATIITDGERLAINTTGNSGMATGGSGDLLTGLIASLLASGMDAFEASWMGAHVHGLAGDIAAQQLSERYMTSADIADRLSDAWKQVDTNS